MWPSNVTIVYADDFTGAAALGGALRELSVDSFVANAPPDWSLPGQKIPELLILNSATRDAGVPTTRKIVRGLLESQSTLAPMTLLFRVDSTMRGNIATIAREAGAFLAERTGREALICVSIANPQAGRTVEGGQLRISGVLASDTELAQDPTWKVTTSDVAEFLFGLPASVLALDGNAEVNSFALIDGSALDAGIERVGQRVRSAKDSGAGVIIFDGRNMNDSEIVGKVLRELDGGVPLVVLDSGPVLSSLLRRESEPELHDGFEWAHAARPVVVVSGSSTGRTSEQLERLRESASCVTIPLLHREKSPIPNTELGRELEAALALESPADVIELNSSHSSDQKNVEAIDFARPVRDAIAQVAALLLDHPPAGLAVVGGETCLYLLEVIGAQGIRPLGLLEPLVAFGTVAGGPLDGMPIVTKGGLVGGDNVLERAVLYLKREAISPMSAVKPSGQVEREGS